MVGYHFGNELIDYGKCLGMVFEEVHPVDMSVVVDEDNVLNMVRHRGHP